MSLSVKNAVILAAGKGIRLDRGDHPKPLVHVGHASLLVWTIERLQDAGVDSIWIVAGTYADAYRKELLGMPSIQATIHYLESETGGGDLLHSVRAIPETVAGPYILTVADVVAVENPYACLLADATGSAPLTSLRSVNADSHERSGAQLYQERDGRREAEMGIYVVQGAGGQLFSSVSSSTFENALEELAQEGRVDSVSYSAPEWYDVNTPATAVRAEMFLREHVYRTPGAFDGIVRRPVTSDGMFFREKHLETQVVIQRGLLDHLGALDLLKPRSLRSPLFLLTDTNVDAFYGDRVLKIFRDAGYRMTKLVMPAGEHAKNLSVFSDLAGQIFAHGMDEGSVIVGLGGGVVGNMAGFLASTLYRGIGLIHIPTSTMAQVDAAIDFKQAVNSKEGKNLIGSYHAASHVLIDPDTISTLDERHIRNGLAESIKHALAQDQEFFQFLATADVSIRDIAFWEEVIRRTIRLKIPLLNGEQVGVNEMGPQYGHCIGHAIEHLSGYELLHGEAVTIGMCVTAEIAKVLGVCTEETVEAHYAICRMYGLPTFVPSAFSVEDVLATIRYDKHYHERIPRIGIPAAIGALWSDRGEVAIPIDDPLIEKAIQANRARQTLVG